MFVYETEIEQRTLAWHKQRLGKITGSEVGKIWGAGRKKDDLFSVTAKGYLMRKVAERNIPQWVLDDAEMLLTYLDQENSETKAMRFGTEQEPQARLLYAHELGNDWVIIETGSVPHPTLSFFASSPDGLVASADEPWKPVGCIEIKCPGVQRWVEYAMVVDGETLKEINPDYYWQCQSHMAVTNTQWCDFVVYNPFQKSGIHIARISRNDSDIELLEKRLLQAEAFIEDILSKIQK